MFRLSVLLLNSMSKLIHNQCTCKLIIKTLRLHTCMQTNNCVFIYRFTVHLFWIVYNKVFNLGLNMVNNMDPDQLKKDFVRWFRTSCSDVAVMRSFRGESVGQPNFGGYLPKSRKSFPMIDLNCPVLSGHQYIKRSRTRFRRSQRIIFLSSPLLNNHYFSKMYHSMAQNILGVASDGHLFGGQFVGWCIIRLTFHYRRLLGTPV